MTAKERDDGWRLQWNSSDEDEDGLEDRRRDEKGTSQSALEKSRYITECNSKT